MSPLRWQQIQAVFEVAWQQQPAARRPFLDQACVADPSLLAHVQELLTCAEQADQNDFLENPYSGDGDTQGVPSGLEPLHAGRRLGPYQVQERLGSGGMGCVYRAVRVDDYRQDVAIKLIRPGADSDELRQRFLNERQLLAGLNHPHIARLLDGGLMPPSQGGLPYFVMEYIAGLPLSRYCDVQQLTTNDRLRLFRSVCLAVHYAHEQGVIHRDLKPDNVLVTADGVAKITDFGLAKHAQRAEGFPAGDPCALTQTGAIMGSPSFMAPEQADGKANQVGPAADVYALGAILYELLTGRPPFRAESPLHTVLQVLYDDAVPPGRLHPNLPRDVETICLKCLEKEPHKRYGSAEALADDVGRFLGGEPIQARPVTRAERLWRWCRRKPLVASLLVALVLILAGGFAAVLSLWILAEQRGLAARQEKEQADNERDQARQAVDDMYTNVAEKWLAAEPHMQEVQCEFLQKALRYYEAAAQKTGADEQIRHKTAQIHRYLGNLHAKFGDITQAREAHQKAVDLWQQLAKEYPHEARYSLALFHGTNDLALVLPQRGAQEAAFHQALAHAEHLVERFPKEPLYWDLLANHCIHQGRLEEGAENLPKAEEYYRRGLEIATKLTEEYPHRHMFAHNVVLNQQYLGRLLQASGQIAEAETAYRAALTAAEKQAASQSEEFSGADRITHQLELALCQRDLALLLQEAGRFADAEQLLKPSLTILAKLADDYPAVPAYRTEQAIALDRLAACYHAAGRAQEADKAYQDCVTLLEECLNDSSWHRASNQYRLASLLCNCKVERLRDSIRALALAEDLVRSEPKNAVFDLLVGMAAYRAGDFKACVPALQEGLAGSRENRIMAGFFLAMAHERIGDPKQARHFFGHADKAMADLHNPELRDIRAEADAVLGLKPMPATVNP